VPATTNLLWRDGTPGRNIHGAVHVRCRHREPSTRQGIEKGTVSAPDPECLSRIPWFATTALPPARRNQADTTPADRAPDGVRQPPTLRTPACPSPQSSEQPSHRRIVCGHGMKCQLLVRRIQHDAIDQVSCTISATQEEPEGVIPHGKSVLRKSDALGGLWTVSSPRRGLHSRTPHAGSSWRGSGHRHQNRRLHPRSAAGS
jgi:hypothetical protein